MTCKDGCGMCCVNVPLDEEFLERYRELGQAEFKVLRLSTNTKKIYPLTKDGLCFLLNRETKKCSIYYERPAICRDFGNVPPLQCPYYDYDGNERTPDKVQDLLDYYYHTNEKRRLEFKISGVTI